MTKSICATSLQSVSHFASGNGVAAAVKRILGRGHSFQFHNLQCAGTSVGGMILLDGGAKLNGLMPSGIFLGSADRLPLISLPVMGRDWLTRYQRNGAVPGQGSGRYRNESTVLTKC